MTREEVKVVFLPGSERPLLGNAILALGANRKGLGAVHAARGLTAAPNTFYQDAGVIEQG